MIDRLDRKILQILQEDATVPVAEIGRRVGLSTTPCWRRIQKLEEEGVITGRVALLDPRKVNTRVTAFVAITTNQHNDEWLKRFAEVIRDFPEVVEFYRMAGQVDYLLRVVVPDIEAYDAFYKRLIAQDRDLRRVDVLRHGADQVHDGAAAQLHRPRQGEGARLTRRVRASRGTPPARRARPCRRCGTLPSPPPPPRHARGSPRRSRAPARRGAAGRGR